MKIIRIVNPGRFQQTVPKTVKRYCLISSETNTFMNPTKENIIENQVIITTTAQAYELVRLDLQGVFTHIFIDEAGQALETEVIMSLCLADNNTCTVLAGDHRQMNPEVFGAEARNNKLHVSLLERLYLHYQQLAVKANPTHKLPTIQNVTQLNKNYRSDPTILKYLSKVFYGGEDNLMPYTKAPRTTSIPGLSFWRTDGVEIQDANATSYYNVHEVNHALGMVKWLLQCWPQEWGECQHEQIAVISAYPLQVRFQAIIVQTIPK